jgi:hypothetical protein
MIWPKSPRQQTLRELYAFNLDEDTLRKLFIEPYDVGRPITWSGRSLDGGDVSYLKVSETAAPFNEDNVRNTHNEYEAFTSGRDVTNDWITGPPGSGKAPAREDPDPLATVLHLCKRFDVVARQLGRRRTGRDALEIADEYDVQYLMHALLLVSFEDVRAESWNPSYLGGATRIDFLLPEVGIVVEVKKTRDTLTDKQVGKELAEDVTRYSDPSANRGASLLVCFVYDPDLLLQNPVGLARDLADASNERLRVVGIVG